jgi:dihydrofolate synthase/folylpolyglutamate synthase
MNVQDCSRYLEKIQNLGIKFGLDNVREILSAFGHPQLKFPSVLVAGTNGKGSVCAFLTRILTLHDLRVGLFTSPHLIRVEERLRIGDRPIPVRVFCRLLTDLKDKIGELMDKKRLLNPPTFFEHLTCLAFLYFAEEEVDIGVLEVGMGGRFDATNVVTPLVSVITTISAEHQKFLGRTLSQIAFEKAGIIKPGIPAVCGVRKQQAFKTILRRAEALDAPLLSVFDRKHSLNRRKTEEGFVFSWRTEEETYSYRPSLRGEHQGKNAAVAIAACRVIGERWKHLKKENIIEGIQTTTWEGRLEAVSHEPLVLLDGAHNEEGAQALRAYVQEFVHPPLFLVYAAMRDKNIEKIADILFPLADKIVLTRFPYFRAAWPEELKEKVPKFKDRIMCQSNVKRAFRRAVEMAGPKGTVLAAGSLFLVGAIKDILRHS